MKKLLWLILISSSQSLRCFPFNAYVTVFVSSPFIFNVSAFVSFPLICMSLPLSLFHLFFLLQLCLPEKKINLHNKRNKSDLKKDERKSFFWSFFRLWGSNTRCFFIVISLSCLFCIVFYWFMFQVSLSSAALQMICVDSYLSLIGMIWGEFLII